MQVRMAAKIFVFVYSTFDIRPSTLDPQPSTLQPYTLQPSSLQPSTLSTLLNPLNPRQLYLIPHP